MASEPHAEGAARSDPMIGTVLKGTWRALARLGAGGMGVVYRGEHVEIGRPVAIKVLRAAADHDASLVERFHREARASARIGDAHVVEVLDFGRLDTGAPFMVMELLSGVELGALLAREGPLSIPRAAHVAAQLCGALAAVHRSGIVHRDLKPENVFLVRRGDDHDFVKILDFGISKFHAPDQRLTESAAFMGSVRYMAPEQAEGSHQVDGRADLYAVGAVLFHCLTGEPPYAEGSFMAVLYKAAHAPVPDVRAARPEVPDALAAAVTRALAKSPEDRFADGDAFRRALLPFARGSIEEIADTAVAFEAVRASTPSVPSDPTRRPDASDASVGAPAVPPSIRPTLLSRARRAEPLVAVSALMALASVGVGATLARESRLPSIAPRRPTAAPVVIERAATPEAAPRVRVALRTSPDRAEVFIDGELVGATPYVGEVTVGAHRVELRRPGYEPEVLSATVDRARDFDLTLRRERSAANTPARSTARTRSTPAAESAPPPPTAAPTEPPAPLVAERPRPERAPPPLGALPEVAPPADPFATPAR